MKNIYIMAPLPFQGQKRFFAKEYANTLRQMAKTNNITTIVDLFGGSGLLSRIAKDTLPDCEVVYNDYDDFHKRIVAIPQTNKILADIRFMLSGVPKLQRLDNYMAQRVFEYLGNLDAPIDYRTLSTSLLFSGQSASNLNEFRANTMYNKVKASNYNADNYLDGLSIIKCDYLELLNKYKDDPTVLFVIDPPYLSTDTKTYNSDKYWHLRDYLGVLKSLKGINFIYFTSSKSQLIELAEWLGDNYSANPFAGAEKITRHNTVNSKSSYEDIMLYRCGTQFVLTAV